MQERVSELLSTAQERTLVTIESVTQELEAARILAMADEKGASAAVAASMGKAKLHGLLVDRAQSTNVVQIISDEPMTEDEWIAAYSSKVEGE